MNEKQEIKALPILITRRRIYPYFETWNDEELGFYYSLHLSKNDYFVVNGGLNFELMIDCITVQQHSSNIPLLVDNLDINLLISMGLELHIKRQQGRERKTLLGAFKH